MNPKEIVRSGYNAIAAEYTALRSEDTEDIQLLRGLVERLPSGAKVLDAGCGSGVPVTRFLTKSFSVTGVDFAEEQIRRARQLVPEAKFLCVDLTKLALSDEQFDAVCSYYTTIHIPREEHHGLLKNFHRMLKPNGLLLVGLGTTDEQEDFAEYHGVQMFWSHYDAGTNLRMIKECGFDTLWTKLVEDPIDPGGGRGLFVLARKT